MDLALITVVIQLIFLEGVLSIDNAAVLGAMVAPLPDDAPVPWPGWLHGVGRWLDPMLGAQRDAALKVGLLGAYVGRGLMLALASVVIRNLWLRLVGALYLLHLAIGYLGRLGREEQHHQESSAMAARGDNFWSIVLSLELADLAFSLDNVVAAVALSDRYWVVLLGVALGIVTMRFAAGIFSRLIEWEPALQHAAYLLVLAISVELVLEDIFHLHLPELGQFAISLGILLLTIAFARVSWLRPLTAMFSPVLWLFAMFHRLIELILWPLRALLRLLTNRRPGVIAPFED